MYRLFLLGGVSLKGPSGPLGGRIVQRRQLALLSLLAASHGKPVTREKLVGLMWPETPEERGRHLLSDTLWVIRQELGADAVVEAGGGLRLDPEVVWSDVAAFEGALGDGRAEEAVELHGGPLLDGFYLEGSGEFERWAEEERRGLEERYREALEALAEEAEARGEREGAVRWWKRRAVVEPVNTRVAVRLMEALAAAGNRAGALEHARAHEAVLRRELGVEMPAEVAAAVERIEAAAGSQQSTAPRFPDDGLSASKTGASPSRPRAEADGDASAQGPRRRFTRTAVVLTGVTLAAALLVPGLLPPDAAPPPDSPDSVSATTVAVLPFAMRGADELAYLSEGMVDLLSTKLDGAGELSSADPHAVIGLARQYDVAAPTSSGAQEVARAVDAGLYLLGSVVEASGRLHLRADLYEAGRSGEEGDAAPLASASVTGAREEIFDLVDRLVAGLLADLWDDSQIRLAGTAALTTDSLAALKIYLAGETAWRRGRWRDALEHFRDAAERDSTFALAHYRAAVAGNFLGERPFADTAAARAVRNAGRLTPPDRALLQANLAFQRMELDEAERRYRQILARRPGELEAWFQLGDLLFHHNPPRGRPVDEAIEPLERVLGFDSEHAQALVHRMEVAALLRDYDLFRSLLERLDPTASFAPWARATRAVLSADPGERERSFAELVELGDRAIRVALYHAACLVEDIQRVDTLARRLVPFTRLPESRAWTHVVAAYLDLASGRPGAAQADLDRAARHDPRSVLMQRALVAVVPFAHRSAEDARRVRDLLLALGPPATAAVDSDPLVPLRQAEPLLHAYVLGLLEARLGNEDAALDRATELRRAAETTDPGPLRAFAQTLAGHIRAEIEWLRGRPEVALDALGEARPVITHQVVASPFVELLPLRWTEAALLRAAGRPEEALRVYGSFAAHSLHSVAFRSAAHLPQAEILAELGRAQEAARHYRRFLELRRNAEPALQSDVTRARQKLAQLEREDGGA